MKKLTILIFGLLAAITIFTIRQGIVTFKKDKKIQVLEKNIAAVQDTIRITKEINKKLEHEKQVYLSFKPIDLKKINPILYNEIESIKGYTKTILYQQQSIFSDTMKLVVKEDSSKTVIACKNDTLFTFDKTFNFSFDTTYSLNNYRKFWGKFHVTKDSISGSIDKFETGLSEVTGIKKVGNHYELFVKSDFPGLKITELDGVYVDKTEFESPVKQPLLIANVSVGYIPLTYDWKTKNIDILPNKIGATVGVGINLKRLFKK